MKILCYLCACVFMFWDDECHCQRGIGFVDGDGDQEESCLLVVSPPIEE